MAPSNAQERTANGQLENTQNQYGLNSLEYMVMSTENHFML